MHRSHIFEDRATSQLAEPLVKTAAPSSWSRRGEQLRHP